ncbi:MULTISPECIES: ABC transporter ATP-binding protein [Halorussus]|uniref:dipeptide ABC transporter ATP-binding protein n=1 Tax=Halorussus TaxID=1070314 RepID=UPI000E218679|nr:MULTISPECIES: ABC transporter ATP-binding protein [Halorussus]NHN61683.1 ABC transporter ATP-binding protein [Halorussus sp. JP-T4]
MSLLEVDDLTVTYRTEERRVYAVNGVSFDIEEGEIYGLVGESGSGKSTIGDAVLGLLPNNGSVGEESRVQFDGHDMLGMEAKEQQHLRWEDIAYIPQSAMDALDPVMSTGSQIVQAIRKHRDVSKKEARERVKEVFDTVGLDSNRIDDYPHEFSGGMRQRVTIAMAMALEPKLIIADEPTTGLDVIVQDKIHSKILEMQERTGASLLMITHDIGVIAEMADKLSILYGGKVMEQGSTEQVLNSPSNPYTMGLKNSFPELDNIDNSPVSIPGSPPVLESEPTECVFRERCPFAEEECEAEHPPLVDVEGADQQSACHFADEHEEMRALAREPETWGTTPADEGESHDDTAGELILETNELKKWYPLYQPLTDKLSGAEPDYVKAVDGVDINVHRSEIVGLAGESGCGKSTLGETVVRLEDPTDGEILFKGDDIAEYREKDMQQFRKDVQFVFQDPFDSLNPRQRVRRLITEPLKIHDLYDAKDGSRQQKVIETLEEVGLGPAERYLEKYPHELSGGERQRVAVARALAVEPDFIVCDEPASMLDVSLKMGLLNLFKRLSRKEDIGILYISHDLASLAHVSDRLAIMYLGRLVEVGNSKDVITSPRHPYTAALLAASPDQDPTKDRQPILLPGEPPDPVDLPEGCNFAPRCPHAQGECRQTDPELTAAEPAQSQMKRADGNGETAESTEHRKACYFPMKDDEDIGDLI